MSRNRLFIILGGCLLAASAAWADDVGYVECSSHPDGTQVFAKPRKSPEVVASMACGERFTILVYGFVFSRVQTGDGKVGYVYSNMIAVDRAAAPVQKPASPQMVAASEKVPVRTAPVAQPAPPPVAKPQPAPAQSTVTAAPQPVSPAPASPAPAASAAPTSAAATPNLPEITVPAAPPAPAAAPASGSLLPTPSAPETTVTPAPVSSATAPSAATSSVPEPAAQPEPSAAAQPQPEAAQPPAIRPVESHTTWERPLPGGRTTTPRVEVFGGYSFARLDGGAGSHTNLNGAMGSFGWNFKPWLQIVADSSYNFVTISGTKNILYGNHFGARYFYRKHSPWGITPFVEALVGGSRADSTVTGVGGYTTSANCMSYKVGGGLDIHPSRHWEIRVLDFDYYRTSFGTNVHQNNYWASTGIVLRLFGGAE